MIPSCFAFLALAWLGSMSFAAVVPITTSTHHLGVVGQPEWDRFKEAPEDDSLTLHFTAQKNATEFTLLIRQDDVKQDWLVTLNGKKLGSLFLMEADLIHTLPVPAGSLVNGENELVIKTKVPEDILIHSITLEDKPKKDLLKAQANFRVIDEESGQPLPSRITITDQNGSLTPIFDHGATNLATRPGVIYTGNGEAPVNLLPGVYTVYATRGPEYSVAEATDFNPAVSKQLSLKIRRAADTRGWIASDTHIHTFELSRHGDAQLNERMITLAAEGIELPVCTEHNQNADYRAAARSTGMDRYFTPVPGNEVTTGKGHFNIFPVDRGAKVPRVDLEQWPDLFREMRGTPGVQVVILNHPTDTHAGFTPFALTNFHILTGRNLRTDDEFEFDAMEVINSGAMRSEWGEPFRAWFALLNRGYKITAVGASDSHDVSRFIVGQGRTYIKVDDSDVAHIDINAAAKNLKEGHAVVSLGLFPQMTVTDPDAPNHPAGPGDLHLARGDKLEFTITVSAPLAKGKAPHLSVWANGVPTKEFYSVPTPHKFSIPKPRQDTYYVLIAEIPGDGGPEWGLARPYQPTSRRINLKFLGATNPIWVDADGDGKFTAPRGYAQKLVAEKKPITEAIRYDTPTIWQYMELAHTREAAVMDDNEFIGFPFKEYFSVEELINRSQHIP